MDSPAVIALIVGIVAFVFLAVFWVAARYKRCPSDKILVVYGRIGGTGESSRCLHGGGSLVWPVIQGYQFLDLTPIPIEIHLQGALSQQNIRINTPSTFTVGTSTEPGVMQNAAERMLGLTLEEVEGLARDIIFGQMRVVIATMPIEEINADREKMISNITDSVEVELRKVGLRLINVNIQDITDESGYIDALGREAAARAINDAKIKVAEQERDGNIGAAEANREKRIRVSSADAVATEGENEAKIKVAESDSRRRQREADAERLATASERVNEARAEQEAYSAEEESERQRAERDKATQYANVVVPAEIERERVQTLAEAEAEKIRRIRQGEADGQRAVMEGEAMGLLALLSRRAEGLGSMVDSTGGSPEFAALLMIAEQLPKLVEEQVKAISNLEIDQITVWDSGGGKGEGGSTANFLSGLVGSLPPLHELAGNVGIKLPKYMGSVEDQEELTERLRDLADRLDPPVDVTATEAEESGEDAEGDVDTF
jgi:flotillin